MSLAWIFPVTFIPGLALLVMSSIHKRGYISQSISEYFMHDQQIPLEIVRLQEKRLELIHSALTSLYLGIFTFALSSLLGGLASLVVPVWRIIMVIMICWGILFLGAAAIILIFESRDATRVMKKEGQYRNKNR